MRGICLSTLQIYSTKWLSFALDEEDKLVACTSSQNSAKDAETHLKGALRRLKRMNELNEGYQSLRMPEIGQRLIQLSNGKGDAFSLAEISQKNWSPARLTISSQLLHVQRGKVISYGGLAKLSSSSPRGVGSVMRSNPVPWAIPCHRVIHSNGELGKLGGTVSGTKEKVRILHAEGVLFNADGTVQQKAIVY